MRMSPSARLTTHVLDTAHGKPAIGMRIDLLMAHGGQMQRLGTEHTNSDGRLDRSFLDGRPFTLGSYELVFHVGSYFAHLGMEPAAPFLDTVPIRFVVSEMAHYHVPLLVSPFAYSTYRGS